MRKKKKQINLQKKKKWMKERIKNRLADGSCHYHPPPESLILALLICFSFRFCIYIYIYTNPWICESNPSHSFI